MLCKMSHIKKIQQKIISAIVCVKKGNRKKKKEVRIVKMKLSCVTMSYSHCTIG